MALETTPTAVKRVMSLLVPVYSSEDVKALKQHVIKIHETARNLGINHITFEFPRSKVAELQAELGVYTTKLKLHYTTRAEPDDYILFRPPHYQSSLSTRVVQPKRETVKYVEKIPEIPLDLKSLPIPSSEEGLVVTPLAPIRRGRKKATPPTAP